MSAAIQSLLESFDDLPEAEQYEVAVEILRRTAQFPTGDMSDEALMTAADERFRELDAREAVDADSTTR